MYAPPMQAGRNVGNLYQGYSPIGGTPYDVFAKDPANIVRNANVSTWYNPNPAPPQFSIKFIPDRTASAQGYEAAAAPLAQAMASGQAPTAEQSQRMAGFWNDPANYGPEGIVDGPPPSLGVRPSADPSVAVTLGNQRTGFDPEAALQAMIDAGSPKGRIVMSGALPPEARMFGLQQRMNLAYGDEGRRAALLKQLADMQNQRRKTDVEERRIGLATEGTPGQMIALGVQLHEQGLPEGQEMIRRGAQQMGEQAARAAGAGTASQPQAPTFADRAANFQMAMRSPVLDVLGITPDATSSQVGDAILQRLQGEGAIDETAIGPLQKYLQLQAVRNPRFLDPKDTSLQGRILRQILSGEDPKKTIENLRGSKRMTEEQKKKESEWSKENLLRPVGTVGGAIRQGGNVYSPYGP